MSVAPGVAVELPTFEVVGPAHAPVIVVLGGISASRHICAHAADTAPGWWDSIAGAGRALDTRRWRLLSFDYLSHHGVTTHDQADVLAALLDEAHVERVHAVIGASYGGMVALAFAERYPDRLQRLIAIGAANRAHPFTTALRVIQRRIVQLGVESGREFDGVALARALAMTTYRSAAEFETRFQSADQIESYLLKHGERFAARFTAERFLALSLSADTHEVDAGAVRTPTTFVAAEGDTLVPLEQIEQLARSLAAPSRIVGLPTRSGHDGFLTEPATLGPILTDALDASILS